MANGTTTPTPSVQAGTQPTAPVNLPSPAPISGVPTVPVEESPPVFKQWSFWITLFLLLNLLVFGYIWVLPIVSPPIVIEDQPIAARFHIKKLRAPTQGRIEIQIDTLGAPGLTIARSNLLIADTYTDFEISMEGEATLPPETVASIVGGTKAYVTFYKGESDKEVVRDILGRKLQATFTIKSTP